MAAGRALKKHEDGRVYPLGFGAMENVLFLPVFEDIGVQLREADTAGNGIEHVWRTSGVMVFQLVTVLYLTFCHKPAQIKNILVGTN